MNLYLRMKMKKIIILLMIKETYLIMGLNMVVHLQQIQHLLNVIHYQKINIFFLETI